MNTKQVIADVKAKIPMEKINDVVTMAKGKLPARFTQNYPDMDTARKIIKRIDYLFAEESNIKLGKQQIFSRDVTQDDGTKKLYTYTVDFDNPTHIKRLRTVLTELVDLTDEDASPAKKESIPGYLDYVAVSEI